AQLGQAMEAAVVAGVGTLAIPVVLTGKAQQRIGEIELGRRRLTARQVELEALGLQVGVVELLLIVLCVQFVTTEGLKRHRAPSTNVSLRESRGPRAPARAH